MRRISNVFICDYKCIYLFMYMRCWLLCYPLAPIFCCIHKVKTNIIQNCGKLSRIHYTNSRQAFFMSVIISCFFLRSFSRSFLFSFALRFCLILECLCTISFSPLYEIPFNIILLFFFSKRKEWKAKREWFTSTMIRNVRKYYERKKGKRIRSDSLQEEWSESGERDRAREKNAHDKADECVVNS